MKIKIIVEVDEGSADPGDKTGLTAEAYDRLTIDTEHGPSSLGWMGEVQEVEKVG